MNKAAQIEKNRFIQTLRAGKDPTRASQSMRQESSPTLQNSCALQFTATTITQDEFQKMIT